MKYFFYYSFALSYAFSIYQIQAQEQPRTANNRAANFLYTSRTGSLVRSCCNRPWLSKAAGYCADRCLSKKAIKRFAATYNINTSEAEKELSEYATLNEFFARALRPGARPIDETVEAIVSPADGNMLVIEHIQTVSQFPVKGCSFVLERFLSDKALAGQFVGGTLIIVRISPGDYHRFHFPYACTPDEHVRLNGLYESVDPVVYLQGVQPLTENERHRITLTLPDKRKMIMAPVGAMCVGKIKETYATDMSYDKGAQAGYFEFGGSTVVLLFPPNSITVDQKLVERSKKNIETPVKMGQKIGILR